MPRPSTHLVPCLLFVSAAAASGQTLRPSDATRGQTNLRFQIRTQVAPVTPSNLRSSPESNLFGNVKPGVAISRQSYREQDGSALVARGLIRSWSVTPGVNAGAGLFSVTHEDQKEPEFRHSWNAKNVGPRNRRVAAVGLNVRF